MLTGFKLVRLRRGEWLAAAAAVVLLVLLFALPWFGPASRSLDGWRGLAGGRWLVLVAIAAAVMLGWQQASRRSPAIPVTLSVYVTVLGLLSALWLLFRVALDPPGHRELAAYLGLVAGFILIWGGFLSMRREGIRPEDGPPEIPVVPVEGT